MSDIRTVAASAAFCLTLLLSLSSALAGDGAVVCGVADGYPPYQYLDGDGTPQGVDVLVARLVFERMGRKLTIRADAWDDVVASLRLGRLDCVAGMEINDRREVFFDFTTPYYERKVVVFLRADEAGVESVTDLKYQVVAGDRDSFVERSLREQGLHRQIRLVQTRSKEHSFEMLKAGTVVAAIAPLEVGLNLARQVGLDVRILDLGDTGSPVGFAVQKGDTDLLSEVDAALRELIAEGRIREILAPWTTR